MDVDEKDLSLQTEETDGHMFATLEQIRHLQQKVNSSITTASAKPLKGRSDTK